MKMALISGIDIHIVTIKVRVYHQIDKFSSNLGQNVPRSLFFIFVKKKKEILKKPK